MKLGIQSLSIAWTLSLAACGSGPISLDTGDGETGDGETGDGDGDGDPGDGDGDPGDGDGDPGDGDGDPQSSACIDENGLVPGVLRLEHSPARAWILQGGAEIELSLEGSDNVVYLVGAGTADHVAVARVEGQSVLDSIVHWFSRSTGELLWTRDIDLGVQQLWAAEDGWVAGTVTPYLPGEQVGFAISQDQTITLTNHEPLAAPALGYLAAYEVDMLGSRVGAGWIDLADLGWHPASPEPLDGYNAAAIGEDRHTLEYLALVDGSPVYVLARPGESESIALPLENLPNHSLQVATRTGRYHVIQQFNWSDDMDVALVRVDVESGEAALVDPEPPQGWSFFDCYNRRIAVDGDGLLYYELRDDASASVWAYDVDGDDWTQLGFELGLVDDIDVFAQSRDVLSVHATAQFQTFCPPTEWAEAPEDALIGGSMQLVRREPALAMVLPENTWQTLIDRQQRCVAFVGDNGWEVRALDGSDAAFEVDATTGLWHWLD